MPHPSAIECLSTLYGRIDKTFRISATSILTENREVVNLLNYSSYCTEIPHKLYQISGCYFIILYIQHYNQPLRRYRHVKCLRDCNCQCCNMYVFVQHK